MEAPRLTPYEVAFADAGWEMRVFPGIEREAEQRGIDPADRDRFGFLSVADEALLEVVPPDAPPEALEQFRALLRHAVNFWRFGRRLYVVAPAVARYLVEAPPELADWELRLPYPSLYVQLPANLFWASVSPDAIPEPVDGFFATARRGDDPLGPPFRWLDVLLVLGMHRNRAGFSVIPFETEVGTGISRVWVDGPGRQDARRDFANVLPGGEISGLYSILTTTEALKLLARLVWYAERNAGDVLPTDPRPEDPASAAPLSRLPYYPLTLDAPTGPAA